MRAESNQPKSGNKDVQDNNLELPVRVKDRQLAVLAVHVVMTMRRLINAQWWGQATVAKAEAARGQKTINQKVAAKMIKIVL